MRLYRSFQDASTFVPARSFPRNPRIKPGEESSLGTRFREDERHEEVHVDTDLAHNTRGEVTAT